MLDTPPVTDFNTMAVTDKAFYRELGARIATARKAQGLTQVQLAEALGIAQQTLAHYEGGKLRVAVALLPPLAQLLGLSVDELIGTPAKRGGKRGPAPRLQQQIERLSMLPQAQQRLVMQMLDGVIAQAAR
ncbi:MAG TPA: helix-turn-helix domain-containing protein [Steroidobacteraceae bacterium]